MAPRTTSATQDVAPKKGHQGFVQAAHPTLVIPGPIEVSDEVLFANAHPSTSHMSPGFAAVFKECLDFLKVLLKCEKGQGFVVAGSGTLGWDMVAANLTEPGDDVLLLNSGYFGDSFAECLALYGAKVTQIKSDLGDCSSMEDLEAVLKSKRFKLVCYTHVDTSTGVLSDPAAINAVVHHHQPEALTILDGVCSVAVEPISMDDMGVDVVLTASQKGLGVPPGLCIVMANERAIKVAEHRKVAPGSYYASWTKLLPVMRAYGKGQAAYFGTPPVQLIFALQAGLRAILCDKSMSLEARFRAHKKASDDLKAYVQKLGLRMVPNRLDQAAAGMSAIYTPDSLKAADVVPLMLKRGVVIAAGLHKDIKDRYIRIGHMGLSVVDGGRQDMEKVKNALRESLAEAGYTNARL